jgi:hypothetical protein
MTATPLGCVSVMQSMRHIPQVNYGSEKPRQIVRFGTSVGEIAPKIP